MLASKGMRRGIRGRRVEGWRNDAVLRSEHVDAGLLIVYIVWY